MLKYFKYTPYIHSCKFGFILENLREKCQVWLIMINRCITQAMPFFRKQDWDKNYEDVRSVCPLEEKTFSYFIIFSFDIYVSKTELSYLIVRICSDLSCGALFLYTCLHIPIIFYLKYFGIFFTLRFDFSKYS